MGGTILEFSADKYFYDGVAQGEKKGEDKLAALIDNLIRQGRYDDVSRCTGDEEYRNKLYEEFRIA